MSKPQLQLADPWSDPETLRKNREFVEKEWATYEATLSEKEKEIDHAWQHINYTWLTRLREAHERIDGMARYCRIIEETCRHLEARLKMAEECIHASQVFYAFRHIYMPKDVAPQHNSPVKND